MAKLGKSICNKCGGRKRYKGEAGLLFCSNCDEWLAPECFPDRPLGAGSSVQVTDAQVDAGAAAHFTWFSSEATTEEQRDVARGQVRRILTAVLAAPPQSNLDGLELAAQFIEAHEIVDSSAGQSVRPRSEGNRMGLAYAAALRALSPAPASNLSGWQSQAQEAIKELLRYNAAFPNLPGDIIERLRRLDRAATTEGSINDA